MKSFWSNKKILITGGHGFIGSNLFEHLISIGANKKLIVRPSSSDFDFRVKDHIDDIVKDKDIIFHLAASVGGLGYNQKYPASIFYDNAIMSLNLMDSAAKNEVPKYVSVGSVRSYPSECKAPFEEKDIWSGPIQDNNAAYAQVKRLMIAQSEFYSQQYGMSCVNLIVSNTYGPKMRLDERITGIAAIIKKIVDARENDSKNVEIWGTGYATRDFVYIDDVVKSLVFFSQKEFCGDAFNIGSGVEISMRRIVDAIVSECKYDGKITWNSLMPEGDRRSVLNMSKTLSEGFKTITSFEEGLQKTIEWYEDVRR